MFAAVAGSRKRGILPGGLTNAKAIAYLNAVFTGGGTVSNSVCYKVDALFNGLDANGLTRYMKALYLFLGGVETTAALNALNPTAVNGAFKGTFVGSPTLTAGGGFTPASGKYFNSNFHPDGGGLLDLTGGGMFYYGTSNITGGEYPIGLSSTFYIAPNFNGTQAIMRCSGVATTAVASVATDGFHWGGREADSSNLRAYRNGTAYISQTVAFDQGYAVAYPTDYAYIGGRLDQVTPANNVSTMPLRLAGFTKGLTSSQVTQFNTLVQDFVA